MPSALARMRTSWRESWRSWSRRLLTSTSLRLTPPQTSSSKSARRLRRCHRWRNFLPCPLHPRPRCRRRTRSGSCGSWRRVWRCDGMPMEQYGNGRGGGMPMEEDGNGSGGTDPQWLDSRLTGAGVIAGSLLLAGPSAVEQDRSVWRIRIGVRCQCEPGTPHGGRTASFRDRGSRQQVSDSPARRHRFCVSPRTHGHRICTARYASSVHSFPYFAALVRQVPAAGVASGMRASREPWSRRSRGHQVLPDKPVLGAFAGLWLRLSSWSPRVAAALGTAHAHAVTIAGMCSRPRSL
mmetsp:Transcript_24640/g.67035  ORF Transcript_24640/g.67035 Transcript_24640/m.67035 type:complete len:294 (-) Transcript_24640:192-1073(-)